MNFKLSPLGQNLVIKYAQIVRILLIVLTIAVIHFVLPKGERFQYEYEKGKTWRHSTLTSPFDYALKKSPSQLNEEKNEISSSTLPIYKRSDLNASKEVFRIKNELKRNLELNSSIESQRIEYGTILEEGARLTKEILDQGYFKIDQSHQGKITVIEILKNKQTYRKNIGSLITKESIGQFLKGRISQVIDESDKVALISVINTKLEPNFEFDSILTTLLITQQLEFLPETEGLIQKGEVIISTGDRITPEKYRMLQNLEEEIAQNSGISQKTFGVNAGRLIIVTLLITILGLFLFFIRQDLYNSTRSLFLILLIITSMIVMVTWALKFNLPSVYLLPYCLVPIIIRVLFDSRIALFIHLIIILILGFSMPNGFEFIFYQFVAGVVSIFSMVNVSKRSQYFFSAGFIFATYALCFTGLSLIKSGDILTVPWRNVSWFFVSVVLSLLAYPLIYLFERLFGITSDMTLLELT
ncbi:MAG: membrane-associated HD superfamily phosphohydrolase, partial [Sphingobacteriales bacterium]